MRQHRGLKLKLTLIQINNLRYNANKTIFPHRLRSETVKYGNEKNPRKFWSFLEHTLPPIYKGNAEAEKMRKTKKRAK